MKTNLSPLLTYSKNDIQNLKKRLCYKGFFSLYEYEFNFRQFNGAFSSKIKREILERRDAVALIAYDDKKDNVILIEQVRIASYDLCQSPWTLELIAGIIDDEKESIEKTAMREAKEEANIDVTNLSKIMSYLPSAGGLKELIHLMVGRVNSTHAGGIYGLESEGEDIKVHVLSRKDAYSLIADGTINNAATIIGLQWLELNYEKLKEKWR